jgi:hypothetical protein
MKNNPEVSALIYLQFILILLKVTNVQPFASYTWLSLTSIFWIPMAIGTALLLLRRKKS